MSLTRLQKFLCQSELNPRNVERTTNESSVFTFEDKNVISVDNGKFSWDKNDAAVLNEFVDVLIALSVVDSFSYAKRNLKTSIF